MGGVPPHLYIQRPPVGTRGCRGCRGAGGRVGGVVNGSHTQVVHP